MKRLGKENLRKKRRKDFIKIRLILILNLLRIFLEGGKNGDNFISNPVIYYLCFSCHDREYI